MKVYRITAFSNAFAGENDPTPPGDIVYRLYRSDSTNIDSFPEIINNGTLVEEKTSPDFFNIQIEESGTVYVNLLAFSPVGGYYTYDMRSITAVVEHPETPDISDGSFDITETEEGIQIDNFVEAEPGNIDPTPQENLVYRLYKSDSANINSASDIQNNGQLLSALVDGEGNLVTQWPYAESVVTEIEDTGTVYFNISVTSPGVGTSAYDMQSIFIESPGFLIVPTTAVQTRNLTDSSFDIRFERADDTEHNRYDVLYKLFTGFDESNVTSKISSDNFAQSATGNDIRKEAIRADVTPYGVDGETICSLIKIPHNQARGSIFGGGTFAQYVRISTGNPNRIALGSSGGAAANSNVDFPDDEWFILTAIHNVNGETSRLRFNGSQVAVSSSFSVADREFLAIGAQADDNPPPIEMQVRYVASVDEALTTTQAAEFENFIATEFEIDGFDEELTIPVTPQLVFDSRTGITTSGGVLTAWQSQGSQQVDTVQLSSFHPPIVENDIVHFNKHGYFSITGLSPAESITFRIKAENESDNTLLYDFGEEITLDESEPPTGTLEFDSISENSDNLILAFNDSLIDFKGYFGSDIGYEVMLDGDAPIDVGNNNPTEVSIPVGEGEDVDIQFRPYNPEGPHAQWSDIERYTTNQYIESTELSSFTTESE